MFSIIANAIDFSFLICIFVIGKQFFINENMPQQERLIKLNKIAIQQMSVLQEVENRKLLK